MNTNPTARTYFEVDADADGITLAGIRIDDTEARRIADALHDLIENRRTETQ